MSHRELEKALSDKSRQIKIRGLHSIVPLKFDKDGDPLTPETPDSHKIIKRLNLKELRFLKVWREADWNVEKAKTGTELTDSEIEHLVKRLQCFREEDARVRALAEIPKPEWVSAKHVENFYEGGQLNDSQRDSLKELAKIQGAYKNQPTLQGATINVFQLPKLSPEAEAKLKTIADQEAKIIQEAQVVGE